MYISHERDDNLALCLNAFALPFVGKHLWLSHSGQTRSPEDIYRVFVPLYRNSYQIKRKPQILDVPVFHQTDRNQFGACISSDRKSRYDAFSQLCQPTLALKTSIDNSGMTKHEAVKFTFQEHRDPALGLEQLFHRRIQLIKTRTLQTINTSEAAWKQQW
jgi:Protein of unknown function (DUF3435)